MQFCRLCTELCTKSINLFLQTGEELLQQIKNITGISLLATQDLPQHICEKCQINLEISHKFRMQCINSQKYFSTTEYKAKIANTNETSVTITSHEHSNEGAIEPSSQMETYTIKANQDEISSVMPNISLVKNEPIEDLNMSPKMSKVPLVQEEPMEYLTVEQNIKGNIKQEQIAGSSVYWDDIEFMELSKISETEAIAQQILDKLEVPSITTTSVAPKTELVEKQSGWYCDHCGKQFKRKHYLTKHKRRLGDDKQFQCNFCPKKFDSNFDLKRHVEIHTGVYTKCEECGKQCNTRNILLEHMKQHMVEKSFQCIYCQKKFVLKIELDRHMTIHTFGDRLKTFDCEECGKKFTNRKKFSYHMKRHVREKHLNASCDVIGSFS